MPTPKSQTFYLSEKELKREAQCSAELVVQIDCSLAGPQEISLQGFLIWAAH